MQIATTREWTCVGLSVADVCGGSISEHCQLMCTCTVTCINLVSKCEQERQGERGGYFCLFEFFFFFAAILSSEKATYNDKQIPSKSCLNTSLERQMCLNQNSRYSQRCSVLIYTENFHIRN